MAMLATGSVFAGHRVEALVGRGGMGVVYRARHLELDRVVALKVIGSDQLEDPVVRERFLREARAAASVDHPNVIPLHYAGEEDGVAFLVMRFVDGDDLRNLVRREGPLAPERAADILVQAGEALDAIHASGYVHRDVKPANLLLAAGGHVYVTDFGVAKRVLTRGGATQTGHWVGTLDYAAPEQIRGGRMDARVDVYALGGVLNFMLTGKVPFDRETDEAKMYAHLTDPPPRPSAIRPELPAELDTVVGRAMAKDADDRHPSTGDLGRAAFVAVHGERDAGTERMVATGAAAPGGAPSEPGLAGDAPTRSAPDRPGPGVGGGRGRRLAWAGGLGTLAVAVAAVLLLGGGDGGTGGEPPPPPPKGAVVGKTITGIADRPNNVAVAGGDVWVMSFRGERLVRIDGATSRVRPDGPVVGPGTSDLNGAGDELWASNTQTREVARVDARSGRVTARLTAPAPPLAVATDPDSLWVATATEVLRYDRRTRRRLDRVPVPAGVVAMTAAPGGVWIAERHTPTVAFVRAATGRVGSVVRLSGQPYDVAFGDGYLWATIRADDSVARVDPKTHAVVAVAAAGRPSQLTFACGLVFVAGLTEHAVVMIDPKKSAPVGKLKTGLNPFAVVADGRRVWVTSIGENNVARIDCPRS
jgi:tRNA A-37 threonylcarbamoyl transferase component Bud32